MFRRGGFFSTSSFRTSEMRISEIFKRDLKGEKYNLTKKKHYCHVRNYCHLCKQERDKNHHLNSIQIPPEFENFTTLTLYSSLNINEAINLHKNSHRVRGDKQIL